MDVAISGASGFIGTALTRALEAAGHRVVVLTRPSSKRSRPSADVIAWDPTVGTIDAAGLEGVDVVVNLSGVGIGDRRWTPGRMDEIRESRTRATALLASTIAGLARPPAVFVTASGSGYYGDGGDAVLTEDSGPGDTFLARVCVAWEDAARPAAHAGLRVVWIRTGVVLDPSGGMLRRVLLPFRLGLGGRVGSGRQYLSWITLADEVAAIRHVIDDHTLGGPVNLTAPNPVTNAELAATLGTVLRRPTAIPTPLAPLRLRYGGDLVRELLLQGQRAVPAKLSESGFTFEHPDLTTALRALLGR